MVVVSTPIESDTFFMSKRGIVSYTAVATVADNLPSLDMFALNGTPYKPQLRLDSTSTFGLQPKSHDTRQHKHGINHSRSTFQLYISQHNLQAQSRGKYPLCMPDRQTDRRTDKQIYLQHRRAPWLSADSPEKGRNATRCGDEVRLQHRSALQRIVVLGLISCPLPKEQWDQQKDDR